MGLDVGMSYLLTRLYFLAAYRRMRFQLSHGIRLSCYLTHAKGDALATQDRSEWLTKLQITGDNVLAQALSR
jgi:hypothetical protein